MVLDGVVSASREEFGDLFPFVSEPRVGIEERGLVLGVPWTFGDVGREMIEPPC
jgi:hypothetical protein